MATKTRDFIEVDFDAYAGAESWSDDQPPMIRSFEGGDLLGDSQGLSYEAYSEDGGPNFYLEFNNPTRVMIRHLLDSMPEDFGPYMATVFGFTQI